MLIKVLKSKIHRATITETHLEYEGSITLDEDLLDAAGLVEGEAVLVANVNNGTRHETYIMKGRRASGVVCLNGAAARLGQPGDLLIILGFAYLAPEELAGHRPRKVHVNKRNHIVRGR
ncbi:MAG: aspartate 1-decarboxylase [Planctomycetota bacterium]|nr:aspartate 1-decarboxylase [Planctomycetota bacterium]